MSKLISVEENGNEVVTTFEFEAETDPNKVPPPPPPGWHRSGGVIAGHDACRVEDLLVSGFEDPGHALMLFAEGPEVKNMTMGQRIDSILRRCQTEGVTVLPGETIIDENGWLTFRGWRVSR